MLGTTESGSADRSFDGGDGGTTTVDGRLLAAHARVFGATRVASLVRLLREQVAATLPQIVAACEQGDLFEVQALAHKLAGACEMLGLAASAGQLRTLEAKAGADELADCRNACEGLQALLSRELDEAGTCLQPPAAAIPPVADRTAATPAV